MSNNKITIYCDGGCGQSITLKKSKVHKVDYYFCDTIKHRKNCEKVILSKCPKGYMATFSYNVAGSFSGYSFEKPSQDDLKRVHNAQMILKYGTDNENHKNS